MKSPYLKLVEHLAALSSGSGTVQDVPYLIDSQQLADLLDIKKSTVIYWIKNGFLPSQKIGTVRSVLYRSAVTSYMQTCGDSELILNPDKLNKKQVA